MAITTHKLICIQCEKTEEYIDEYPHNRHKPRNWYILQPNIEHSQWLTFDFSFLSPHPKDSDFCSLECIVAYAQEAIIERDNPKPFIVVGDLTTGEVWGGEVE